MADVAQFTIAPQSSDIRFHYGLSVIVLRMGGTQGDTLMGRTRGNRGLGERHNGLGYVGGSISLRKALRSALSNIFTNILRKASRPALSNLIVIVDKIVKNIGVG